MMETHAMLPSLAKSLRMPARIWPTLLENKQKSKKLQNNLKPNNNEKGNA